MPTWTLPCLAEGWFASPEATKAAVNAFASRNGYAVVTKTTRYDKHKRMRRVLLACDRHGLHQPMGNARRAGSSRKCGCPMDVNVVRVAVDAVDKWQLEHRGTANEHNHPPSEGPETHPELRKASWNAQARQIVLEDARAGVPVKQTMNRLAVETPGVLATKPDVYNERRRLMAGVTQRASAAPLILQEGQDAGTSRQVAAPVDRQRDSVLQPESAQAFASDEARQSVEQVAVPDAVRQARSASAWDLPCLPESSFESPEAARSAVNAFAGRNGYAVVHRSTRYDKNKQPRRIILACDRHGTTRQRTEVTTQRRRKPSRKCDCPMRVNLVRLKADGRWQVQHRGIAREHNHPPSMDPILRRESRTDAVRDGQASVSVSQTLARLAVEAPGVTLTARDVYNPRRVIAESSSVTSAQAIASVNDEDLSGDVDQQLTPSSGDRTERTWHLPCLPESSFASPDAARSALNAFAGRCGYAVVHRSTRYDGNKQPRRIILACDRHGTKRQRADLAAHRPRHAPSSGASSHPILRRESLTEAVRQLIASDAQAGVPVTQTLARVALEAPGTMLTAREVSNQRHAMAAHAVEAPSTRTTR